MQENLSCRPKGFNIPFTDDGFIEVIETDEDYELDIYFLNDKSYSQQNNEKYINIKEKSINEIMEDNKKGQKPLDVSSHIVYNNCKSGH